MTFLVAVSLAFFLIPPDLTFRMGGSLFFTGTVLTISVTDLAEAGWSDDECVANGNDGDDLLSITFNSGEELLDGLE